MSFIKKFPSYKNNINNVTKVDPVSNLIYFNDIEEAYKAGVLLEVVKCDDYIGEYDVPTTLVTYEVIKKLSNTQSPQRVIGVCKKIEEKEIGSKIVILEDLQDPGNLGTIIRSSVAFNVDTIILSPNTVDLYNPKVLRSTQGMFCHINIITMDLVEAINIIKSKGISVYGTNVNNGIDVRSVTDTSSYALIMGNEGNGVKDYIQDMCDKNLYIKMNDKAESLNVGVACSILLYELEK